VADVTSKISKRFFEKVIDGQNPKCLLGNLSPQWGEAL
jgi:hypothetical protein